MASTSAQAISAQAIAIFDIDGVIRDVGQSYRRALADTVEAFTEGQFRPTMADIDAIKAEGAWNNDWLASQELVYRFWESQGRSRTEFALNYEELVLFFQQRYRGPNPEDASSWTGYICDEPLLVNQAYFDQLTASQIAWGFFSGATRASANFVLTQRVGLTNPVLVAMNDAPEKPDPTGLQMAVHQLEPPNSRLPVVYAGDTAADMQTVLNVRKINPDRRWIAVGILPPHALADTATRDRHTATLQANGADVVLSSVTELTGDRLMTWLQ
jgi:HAD superfamily phosphatase